MPTKTKENLRLHVDLRYFYIPLFCLFLMFAPLLRGLFFAADLLPYQVAGSIIMAVVLVDTWVRRQPLLGGPVAYAFLWVTLAYGISVPVAASRTQAIQGFARYAMFFGVYWISWYIARESRISRNLVIYAGLAGSVAVALIGLLSAGNLIDFPGAVVGSRISSTLQYPNALAAFMMFFSIVGFTMWVLAEDVTARILLSLAVYCEVLVFLSSYSRGGWVVYPFSVVALLALTPKEFRAKLVFAICSTLTSVLLVLRQFVTALETKHPGSTLKYALYGALTACLIQAGYYVYKRISSELLAPAARKVVAWAAGCYAGLTFLVYLAMLLAQYGVGLKGVLPASIMKRISSISLDDPSFLTRAFSTKDALRIFLDYPLLGRGAGAWNALYHGYQIVLYWTTEVHNHFAQVLVETGVLGFAGYISVWLLLSYSVLKSLLPYARSSDESVGGRSSFSARDRMRLWGLFVGVISVGIHSAMDFELSLPGVAYGVWAMMGVIAAQIEKSGRYPRFDWYLGRTRRAVSYVLVALVLVSVFVPSFLFQRAAYYGSLGASAMMNHDFLRAEALFQAARRLDPFTGSYLVDIGQCYAARGLLEKRPELIEKAVAAFRQARLLEPYNVNYIVQMTDVLAASGRFLEGAEFAKSLTELVPLDVRSYETFVRLSVSSYVDAVLKGSETSSAEMYLDEALKIPEKLARLKAGVTGTYAERWSPDHLNLTPALKLYLGQAYYLRKDLRNAQTFLSEAVKDRNLKSEADAWMTAVTILEGQMPRSQASPDVQRIISYLEQGQ